MILVDPRVGSADLIGYLQKLKVECELANLGYGDAAFIGKGPKGDISVGVEVKKVRDAINCMVDGRFAGHQLPGLREGFDLVWLVIEGHFNPDYRTGALMVPSGKSRERLQLGKRTFAYRDFDNWITSMEVCGGIRVRRTGGRSETARFIADIYLWLQKEWREHRAHLAFDEDPVPAAQLVRPSLVAKVAKELPGIGWTRAHEVAKKFKTVEEMIGAEIKEWMEIEGIGEGIARRVFHSLRGE